MTHYALADGMSYGLVDGEAVFLDLVRDRYFQVEPPLRDDLDHLHRGAGNLPNAVAARLLDAGLIRKTATRRAAGPAPSFIPAASLLDDDLGTGARWSAQAEIGLLCVRARLAVRWTPLHRLAAGLGPPPCAIPGSEHGARAMARRFEAARRRVPLGRHCLTDSIALLRFLHRRSMSASLIFAVKLHPFAAHCWLQDQEMVLNDDSETARGFVPVLVL